MIRHSFLFELFAEQHKGVYPFQVSTQQPRGLDVEAAISSHFCNPFRWAEADAFIDSTVVERRTK
jgi:hypothetical protein